MLHIIKSDSLEKNKDYYKRNFDIQDVIIECERSKDTGEFVFKTTRELFFENGESVITALNLGKVPYPEVMSAIAYNSNEMKLRDKYAIFEDFVVFSFENLETIELLEIIRVADIAELDIVVTQL